MNNRPWCRGLCFGVGVALCVAVPMPALAATSDGPPAELPSSQDSTPSPQPTPSNSSRGSERRSGGGSGGGGGSNWLIPAAIIGVAALIAVNRHLNAERTEQRNESEGVQQLLRDGPQLPAQYNTSAFAIRALVRGGWPIVVDYAQHKPGRVQLRISTPGADIVTYRLDQFGLGRHLLRFELPPFLGDSLKAGVVALTAADPRTGTETIDGFTVHGIGIGPRAVGSIAVDQLEFNPGDLHVKDGDTASFAFRSRSDFDHSVVEYMRVTQSPDGARKRYVNGLQTGSVQRNSRVQSVESQRWNGQDDQARVSRGRHQLQVRVWDEGGDWVGAWSESLVQIR